jgi:ligand-binding SRPBCC domain-containing protein
VRARHVITALGLALAGLVAGPSLVRGRRYTIEREVIVPAPPEDAFAFFADPANLAKVMPPWLGFQLVRIDGLPMGVGTTIEYTVRALGAPQRSVVRVEEFEAGARFVDVQVRGPYRHWRHEHAFEEWHGSTLVRDRVEYELPYGVLGRVANTMLVARQLQQAFDYRTLAIARLFSESLAGSRETGVG